MTDDNVLKIKQEFDNYINNYVSSRELISTHKYIPIWEKFDKIVDKIKKNKKYRRIWRYYRMWNNQIFNHYTEWMYSYQ